MKYLLPVLICMMVVFWMGFHNVDLAYNFKRMNWIFENVGSDYRINADMNLLGFATPEQVYIIGMSMMFFANFSLLITVYLQQMRKVK